jgi:hypothetical protein
MSSYSRDRLQNHEFGGGAYPQPSAWWVKLHVGDPGVNCTANPAANANRAQVAAWAGSTGGSDASAAAVSWTNVPNAETYTHVSIWDASGAGNPLRYGPLNTPVSVSVGATFSVAAGQLIVTMQ